MTDPEILSPSELTDAENPATLVIRDVKLGCGGLIQVRRINSAGFIEFVTILCNSNAVHLHPTDRILLQGNAQCVVYLQVDGHLQEAVAQIECIRVQPASPVWQPDNTPSSVDYRFNSLQCPPVIDVHELTLDGVAVRQVFVPGGMFQIEV